VGGVKEKASAKADSVKQTATAKREEVAEKAPDSAGAAVEGPAVRPGEPGCACDWRRLGCRICSRKASVALARREGLGPRRKAPGTVR
jgi:hypothetical protein